jgi:dienelactone hydrolase
MDSDTANPMTLRLRLNHRLPASSRRLGSIVVTSLVLAACAGQAASPTSATPQHVPLTVVDGVPPPGINVPGAHWIKIRGAGGVAASEQVAAVFRPSGQGPFPLVIELHGDGGLKDVDVEWAARLAQAGFVALAGCWQSSEVPPDTFQFYELTVRFIACPVLVANEVDAIAALIQAGRQQPGVRSDAVALYGMSSGGAAALQVLASRSDLRAAVVDSGDAPGPEPGKINSAVLFLAGTADEYVPFTAQKNYIEALRRAGKQVEWHYYQGGRHTLILDPANKDDAMKRIIGFLSRHLLGTA